MGQGAGLGQTPIARAGSGLGQGPGLGKPAGLLTSPPRLAPGLMAPGLKKDSGLGQTSRTAPLGKSKRGLEMMSLVRSDSAGAQGSTAAGVTAAERKKQKSHQTINDDERKGDARRKGGDIAAGYLAADSQTQHILPDSPGLPPSPGSVRECSPGEVRRGSPGESGRGRQDGGLVLPHSLPASPEGQNLLTPQTLLRATDSRTPTISRTPAVEDPAGSALAAVAVSPGARAPPGLSEPPPNSCTPARAPPAISSVLVDPTSPEWTEESPARAMAALSKPSLTVSRADVCLRPPGMSGLPRTLPGLAAVPAAGATHKRPPTDEQAAHTNIPYKRLRAAEDMAAVAKGPGARAARG
ncbi:hypothetical protein T492DRAFT_839153 [Pavlovales sp. CCMP2436]|nr:hypothetical protein T492DRAFT_839153 [Pavlovales sp. CCMP2436]